MVILNLTHIVDHHMAVIWMYSKGGGKYGAHLLVLQTSSISQLSFMALQVYEQTFRGQFRAIPNITCCVFAFQYVHLPAMGFLCCVPKSQGTWAVKQAQWRFVRNRWITSKLYPK